MLRHLATRRDQNAADDTARAAKHALLTCALAFGCVGGGEPEVLFAVARSYAAVARAGHRDERLPGDMVEVDGGQFVRKLLRRAEGALCAAAKALPHFSRHTVRHLLRAARAYSDAWELDRVWATRLLPDVRRGRERPARAAPDLSRIRVPTPLSPVTRKEPSCHRSTP